MLEEWGLSLPHAFALGFRSSAPAACQGSLPQPRPPLHHPGHGWHSPPLHPSVYSLYHPSINDPFTEAAEWGLSRACSSFWGMQLGCLHISRDLETSALTEPLSCAFSHLTGIKICWLTQISKSRAVTSTLLKEGGLSHETRASGLNLERVGSWLWLVKSAHLTAPDQVMFTLSTSNSLRYRSDQ